MRHAALAVLAILARSPGRAGAETIYDQPYLGDRIASAPAKPLTADVAAADQIFIGRATRIVETSRAIRATVEPVDVLKGAVMLGSTLALEWHPTTTGIANGSRLIFFLRRGGVFRTMYIYPPPHGRIRAVAGLDGGLDATLATLRTLIDSKAPRSHLAAVLKADATSADDQRVQTAALLAIDLDAPESAVALTEIVATKGAVYRDAVYALMKLDRRHARVILDRVSNPPGHGRIYETDAFAVLATLGDATTVPVLAEFGDKHAEYRVSAAFALARIGGLAARKKIEAWIADPASSAKERISTGWENEDVPRATLYGRALALLKP